MDVLVEEPQKKRKKKKKRVYEGETIKFIKILKRSQTQWLNN